MNEGVDGDWYLGKDVHIRLPTVQFMEERLLELGLGAIMFKTDLARGYRHLRVDPTDWPLLGLQHEGKFCLDVCPPFGLKSSAIFMQRPLRTFTGVTVTRHVHILTISGGRRGRWNRPTTPSMPCRIS